MIMPNLMFVISFMVYWFLISLIAVPLVNKLLGNPLLEGFWFKYFFNLIFIIILTSLGII